MGKFTELRDQVFGKLLVISRGPDRITPAGKIRTMWVCKCVCETILNVRADALVSGKTRSCGCARSEFMSNNVRTHGKSRDKIYHTWTSMKQRCYNPDNNNYKNYGARGITVCDRWLNSFENFLEDMGECPDSLTLERINVNGNYEPSNCRWENMSIQIFNQRRRSTNTSGVTGVSWYNKIKRWVATIMKDGKKIHLGCFGSIGEATIARQQAESKYFGFVKDKKI